MTACFEDDTNTNAPGGTSKQCHAHMAVGVVQCGEFLLWRLPYAPDCDSGFCTTNSGLFDAGRRLQATRRG
jgi:hypothetical protein